MFDTNTRWGNSVPYPRAPRQESVTPFQLRLTQFPALKWIKGQKQLGIQSGSSPILCHPSCALQFTGHRTSPCNFTKFLLAIDPSGLPKQSVHSGLPLKGAFQSALQIQGGRVGEKKGSTRIGSVKSEPWEVPSFGAFGSLAVTLNPKIQPSWPAASFFRSLPGQ